MNLHVWRRIVTGIAVTFGLLAFAPPAAAQPKLESSSLGHWRGYWISTIDPRLQGPVQQFIGTERNRRVHGMLEWNTAAGLLELELDGTTSASCRFNYVLTGMGAAEGVRMVINGMHEVGVAMGEYMYFSPGLTDRGLVFLVQDFDGPAPDARGHYMGTATSMLTGLTNEFALYITHQDMGNFEGFAEAPNTTPFKELGDELRFDFDGRIDGKGHAWVVGLGLAGIFLVEARLAQMPDGSRMFTGDYMIFYLDGSMDEGMLELMMPPNNHVVP